MREFCKAGLSAFDRVEAGLYRGEAIVASLALAVMMITIVISVAARYFGLAIPNMAELALVSMSPLTFVGAAMCTYLGGHIAVDVAQLLPLPLRRIVRAVATLAQLAFAGLFVFTAWAFFAYSIESGERLLDLGTPVAVPAGFLVLGGALIGLHAAADLARQGLDLPHPGRAA